MHTSGLLYGITIAVVITIGGFASLSISHKLGSNKTRVTLALSNGDVKVGKSTCANLDGNRFWGCNPRSDTVMETTQSYNLSPGDPVALSINRTNGTAELKVGLSTSVKDPSGYVRVGVSATKSYGSQDALSIIDSAPVQAIVPESVNKTAHSLLGENKPTSDRFEVWQKCEEQNKIAERLALIARLQTETRKGVGKTLAFPQGGRTFHVRNCLLAAYL
jgi:hypothetical protein